MVSQNSKNPKWLWFSISGILGKPSRPLETPFFTADDFLDMLTTKSKRLHAATANATPPKVLHVHYVISLRRLSSYPRVWPSLCFDLNKLKVVWTWPPFIEPPFIMELIEDIAPFLLYIFNRSPAGGYIPPSEKRALVCPSLKKPNLDPTSFQNFRPISNLSFISKTLQRLVSLKFLPCLQSSGLLPTRQSGFKAKNSTETTLLSLLSDIYSAVDKSEVSPLTIYIWCVCCVWYGGPLNPPRAPWNLIWNKIPSFTLVKIVLVWSYPNDCLRWIQDLLDSYHVGCPSGLCLQSSSLDSIHCGHSYSFS